MSAPVRRIAGPTLVLPVDDVDTDQIIPARFLTTTERAGLGRHAFAEWRSAPGSPFDHPQAPSAKVLVAGRNFGCGSSREHAAWALRDYGFEAVLCASLADIFRRNALKNGLVALELEPELHARLTARPGATVELDLERCELRLDDGSPAPFALDAFARQCLLTGLDELGVLLAHEAAISAYERARRERRPGLPSTRASDPPTTTGAMP